MVDGELYVQILGGVHKEGKRFLYLFSCTFYFILARLWILCLEQPLLSMKMILWMEFMHEEKLKMKMSSSLV